MTRIAAVTVVVGDDAPAECLQTLSGFDEVYVLTAEERTFPPGTSVIRIERPRCIEEITPMLLNVSSADWVLYLDPDERFVCPSMRTFRKELVRASTAGAGGFWISYELNFLGRSLARTYPGLRKPKLVRPQCVAWSSEIHSIPRPMGGSTFLELPSSVALIRSDLVDDVKRRLARHLNWAMIEAEVAGGSAVDSRKLAETLAGVLREHFGMARGCEDSLETVLNGLMHLQKAIALLLFEAQIGGVSQGDGNVVQMHEILRQAGVSLETLLQQE